MPACWERFQLLERFLDQLAEHPQVKDIALLLLPGGCFRLPVYIGHLIHQKRVATLREHPVGKRLLKLAERLDALSPGAVLVTGVDTLQRHACGHDQMCVAFRPDGVIGLARKIFPANGDTNGDNGWPLVCYRRDYDAPHRMIQLRDGRKVLLNACYDVFGIAEALARDTNRIRFARFLVDEGSELESGEAGYLALRRECFDAWRRWIKGNRPDLVVAAIHQFERPGHDLFWQRHGIAVASAALDGALIVGGSHYRASLPNREDRSSLAASSVPRVHIARSWRRRAEMLATDLYQYNQLSLRLTDLN